MTTQVIERPEAKPSGPLVEFRNDLEVRAREFAMVLPSHISIEKFQRTLLTTAQTNPDLLRCEKRSLMTACMKAAQDQLLPDGREAAIVPFNHRYKDADGWHSVKMAQYLPMVFGLRKKILQSGEIIDLHCGIVYRQELDAGRFHYEEGSERSLRHKPLLDLDFRPTDDDVALAYSVATFSSGFKSYEVMRRWEIDEVREASQSGALFDAKGNRREAKGPWVEWFGEMAKKTVLRRHSKSLPQSGDLITDVEREDLDFAAKSAVALLGQRADEPEKIDGPASGFSVEGEEFTKETLVGDERGPLDDPDDGVDQPPPPKPQPKPEPEPEPVEQLTEPPQPVPVEPPNDEYGITKDPNEALAEDFIKRARKVELLADLKKLETEAVTPLAEMPPEMAREVDRVFAERRKALTPPLGPSKDVPA
jgi:recombination protein RecT